jgi:hypothetical protein
MSALGQKQTFHDGCPMSALPLKADIETGLLSPSTQQLRQLRDIRRDPPRLIFAEQLGR